MREPLVPLMAVVVAMALALSACGDGNDNNNNEGGPIATKTATPAPTATAVPPTATTTTETATPTGGATPTPVPAADLQAARVGTGPSGIDDPLWSGITPFGPALNTVISGLIYGDGQLNMSGTFGEFPSSMEVRRRICSCAPYTTVRNCTSWPSRTTPPSISIDADGCRRPVRPAQGRRVFGRVHVAAERRQDCPRVRDIVGAE